jgi:(p)ppGpp synthase/HD superfamily hydrolase
MTYQEALALATKAHKGQFRRSNSPTEEEMHEIRNYESTTNKQTFIMHSGKTAYVDRNTQNWKVKQPYITHPIAVAGMMDTEEEKIVAILHDVIEDTEAKLVYDKVNRHFYIEYKGKSYLITAKIYNSLKVLTKDPKLTYQENIQRVKEVSEEYDLPAAKVKIADNLHNLCDNPTEKQKEKYKKSIMYLAT